MSIRNYGIRQRNLMKNLSTPFVRKSNLKIINIFGQEILNSGSGQKKLSKTHRPKTGVAAPWELSAPIPIVWNFWFPPKRENIIMNVYTTSIRLKYLTTFLPIRSKTSL